MYRYVEVVQIADGHLFDAECYECACIPDRPLARPPGFYAVLWPVGAAFHRFDSGATFIGPFATAQEAESASEGAHHD